MNKKTKSFLSLMAAALAMVNLSSCGDEVSTNIKEYDPNPVVIVPEPIMNNGHECVDLGCSVYWSDANVGSETPNGQGWYFAWGGLVIHTSDVVADPRNFGQVYEFGSTLDNQNLTDVTKYNTTDNLTTLEVADDAARLHWGGTWRIPTKAEFQELMDSCYWEWTNNYKNTNRKGFIVFKAKAKEDKGTVKYDGLGVTKLDGKSIALKEKYSINNVTDTCIFLPAAGFRRERILDSDNKEGNYWTSTVYDGHKAFAYSCFFYNQRAEINDFKRVYGCNVRAVCDK